MSIATLIDFTACLPLSLKQASAYMAETGSSTTDYLGHCQSNDKTIMHLLSGNFEGRSRDSRKDNAIATT